MLLRKIAASLLVILFLGLALQNFFVYALSRTYLSTDFYRRDDVISGLYDFTLDKTVGVLQSGSKFFKGYFTAEELRESITDVFSKTLFAQTVDGFAVQIDQYKADPSKPLTIRLQPLRENLLTVGNNLAYLIYKKLPTCSEDRILLDQDGVPECVPPGLPYEQVVRPLTDNFENTIYNEIPEELSNIDSAVPLKVLVSIENYRNLSFVLLVVVLGLMALILYSKISTILAYFAVSFLLSGGVGYGFSSALTYAISQNQGPVSDPEMQKLMIFLLDFLVDEIQKMSLLFMIVGVAMWLLCFVMRRTIDQKTVHEKILEA